LNNSLFFIKVYFFIKKEWKEQKTLCIDLRIFLVAYLSCHVAKDRIMYIILLIIAKQTHILAISSCSYNYWHKKM